MAGNLDEVTDNNFQAEVVEADKPVLVDFWAPWCGPCRIVAPHLEELAGEREDLRIVKLNVDENPQTAAQYNVMSIPTLLLFKNGQVAHQIIGALPKSRLVQEIEPALEPAPEAPRPPTTRRPRPRTAAPALAPVRAQGAEDAADQRGDERRARSAARVGGPWARCSAISCPSRMKLPKTRPPISPRTKPSSALRCSTPAEEAAHDRDRADHHVVEDLVPAEGEPGEEAEHHRHHDPADRPDARTGRSKKRRRQLHARRQPNRDRAAAGPRSRRARHAVGAVELERRGERLAGHVVLVRARGVEQLLVAAERRARCGPPRRARRSCARPGRRARPRARDPRGAARRRARG